MVEGRLSNLLMQSKPVPDPSGSAADAYDSHTIAFLRFATVYLMLGSIAFAVVLLIVAAEQPVRLAGPGSLMAIAGASWACQARGRIRAAILTLVIGMWLEVTGVSLITGGLHAPAAFLYVLVIFMSGWLLGSRMTYALALMSGAAALAFALADWGNALPRPHTPPALMWMVQAAVFLFSAIMIGRFVSIYRARIVEMEALGRALGERATALAESEASYRGLFNGVNEAIYIQDREGRFLDVNEGAVRMYGYPRERFIGRTPEFVSAPGRNDLAGVGAMVARTFAGEPQRFEFWGLRANGEVFPKEVRLVRGTWHGQQVIIATADDITERKRVEEERARSEEKFQMVFRASPVAIAITRLADGCYLDINDAFIELFGWSREEAVGRTSTELGKWVCAEDRQDWAAELRSRGRVPNYEMRLRTKAGKELQVLFSAEVIELRGEACILVLAIDQTQRKQSEIALKESEAEIRRLNADLERRVKERTAELTSANRELESFAYSISHDLRAPLRGIDGFSHLLDEEYGDRIDDQGRGYIERVRKAVQRMGTLIDDILELSRVTRQEMRREDVDLSRLATEVAEEISRAQPGRRVDFVHAPGCHANGDAQLLRLLLQNLLENAWKYTGPSNTAKVEFGSETADGKTVFFVRDNGVGFDMRYAGRLFSPFERLHKPQEFEGSGVGLATVSRIAHRHGGRIWAEAKPGEGATFRFTLG